MFCYFLAIFSLKKSLKEYQKRLLLLENTSFENQESVGSSIIKRINSMLIIFNIFFLLEQEYYSHNW